MSKKKTIPAFNAVPVKGDTSVAWVKPCDPTFAPRPEVGQGYMARLAGKILRDRHATKTSRHLAGIVRQFCGRPGYRPQGKVVKKPAVPKSPD